MTKYTMKCDEISCKHCTGTIEKTLGAMPGVSSVEASPETKDVTVEFDAPCSIQLIKDALTKAEFPPTDVKEV
eukprot:CAMPEP_0196725540 /NCGR_PEP_ID=MMETSP1091-20130531/7074_1 /TAXON_ID=302021 /ORGANISM="Rhodomonas sp., Strain CCMP768" /LENGTH=72 /DNA_ID=CAMNT_0042067837 /DNA_START=8 /DNA_END=226 /DNA_ORIENTATION=+